jgi:3-deoxy-D-manno-octulosonic-acid transferase
VQTATAPLWLPLLAAHPRLRGGLGQRLGRLSLPLPDRPVWLHGASAGDVAALWPLASRLRGLGYPVVLSAWTRTGEQMARSISGGSVPVLRAPLDLRGAVQRTLACLRPRLLVLECLEIWPRLLAACADQGVPVAVVNGRLSGRSLRRYGRARSLFRPCFASLAYVSALTEGDAARFESAGVERARIEVRPSSKHAGLAVVEEPRVVPPRVVLGSIHREEEGVLLAWLERLRSARPIAAVIAPRYPGRARALRRALARRGIDARPSSTGARALAPGEVELLDGIGELRRRYRGASLAFVGGSLAPRGGHNLVEPAACGVPVLFGPSTEHCRAEAEALRAAGAGVEVRDGESLWLASEPLLADPATWARASRAGRRVATELGSSVAPLAAHLSRLAGEVGSC